MQSTEREPEQRPDRRLVRWPERTPAQRRRRVLRVVGGVAALAVLVGGAAVAAPLLDRGARAAAEARAGGELGRLLGASGGAEVEVGGGWFLPQALRGRYDDVRVVARGVPTGQVRLDEVDARLTGVSLPLQDLLDGQVDEVEVDRATAASRLSYTELDRSLGERDSPLSLAPDGQELRVTGTTQLLGQDLSLSADVDLVADGSTVRAVPRQLVSGSALVDSLSRSVLSGLRDQLAFDVPLGTLPFSQQVTGVRTDGSGLLVSTTGSSIVVGS